MRIKIHETGEAATPYVLKLVVDEGSFKSDVEMTFSLCPDDLEALVKEVKPHAFMADISDQNCEDILIAGIESGSYGISYWCGDYEGHYWEGCTNQHDPENEHCPLNNVPEEQRENVNCTCVHTFKNGGYFKLGESVHEGSKEILKWHQLTVPMLKLGIAKAALHKGQAPYYFMDNHDASDADLAIQYALFDAIIYG